MPVEDPKDLERIDQEIRINELKQEADELSGGEMVTWESEDMPPGMAEQFWERVLAFEKAPWTSHFEQLSKAGVELPGPDTLNDQQLSAKLWEMIEALARMRVFLNCTDHLSDRKLYELLWGETLHEAVPDVPNDESSAWHIDLLSSGGDEDTYEYFKYYADEEWRQRWLADFPDYEMPPHQDCPYDRDRHLPKAREDWPPGSEPTVQ